MRKSIVGLSFGVILIATSLLGFDGASWAGSTVVGSGPSAHYSVFSTLKADSCSYQWDGANPLPDPKCTPGASSPAVNQSNIYSTICKRGYTKSIRPPAAITYVEKRISAKAYGNSRSLVDQEFDHLISLELGGSPNDPRNLWVEPQAQGVVSNSVYNGKDVIEGKLNALVCSNVITLKEAQEAIATNWSGALKALGQG